MLPSVVCTYPALQIQLHPGGFLLGLDIPQLGFAEDFDDLDRSEAQGVEERDGGGVGRSYSREEGGGCERESCGSVLQAGVSGR